MPEKKQKKWIWWKHGVFYHIYPRSFYDSNGDGIGDIPGILLKLDYLVNLGVDAIWLSPVFKSPMVDFGYDVTDYYNIDPVFGTKDDFIRLLHEAHKRNIRVVIDMVLNHTSDRHPWFAESASSHDNPKHDWYIWQKGNKFKKPNNWRSVMGGSAWQFDQRLQEYYLHTFFREQPDLNWRNKEVREAFMDIFRHWLDLGVDGFRLDAVNMIIKDKKFRNNPGLLTGVLWRRRWFTRNQPRSFKIVKQLRKLLDTYDDRMMVGEVYTLPPGDSEMAGNYLKSGDNAMHLAFDFSLMFKPFSARKYFKAIDRWYASIPEKGWPCHVLSNHDLRRIISKYGKGSSKYKRAKVAAMLLLTLRGTPFIYYGEEIGMQNTSLRRSEILDPLGKKFWPFYKGRDKARTPMQWSAGNNAGFSVAKPWLPVNPDHVRINVEDEWKDTESMLTFYSSLIRLRKEHSALFAGQWVPLRMGLDGVIVFNRISTDEKLLILLNFTSREQALSLGSSFRLEVLLSTHKVPHEKMETSLIHIESFEATLMCDLSYFETEQFR
ncbi:MAG: alpha-glucosidase [Bacteroidales bacterium]|nr:alpha-glucosidase [Bacteroidales bacterium]